jgi:hypothetical protein
MEEVKFIKSIIESYDLVGLKRYLSSIDINGDIDYIFQKVYLHTCLLIGKHKRKGDNISVQKLVKIEEFLKNECYPKLPEIQRIAIRQCFAYGKYISER